MAQASATYHLNEQEKTESVSLNRGVKQGDTLSPKLFTLAVEDIFKQLEWSNKGININGKYLSNLRYADDVVITASSLEELIEMLEELNTASNKAGLKINETKTKVMFNGNGRVTINNKEVENVKDYIYLGQKFMLGKENQTEEIKRRTKLAWAAYGKLSFILRNKDIPIHLKTKVFDSCVLPVITYGAQNWVMTKSNMNILRTTQRAMERSMLGISLKDRRTNEWIRQRTGVTDVVEKATKLKWSFAGHVARGDAEKWHKAILSWRPYKHKRPRGRPRMRWVDDLKLTAGLNWMQTAQNRHNWRHNLEEAYIRKWM